MFKRFLLIVLISFSHNALADCIQHQSWWDSRTSRIWVSVANTCEETLDVNVCVNIQGRKPIAEERNSYRLPANTDWQFTFVDFNKSEYAYAVRWCDAGKSKYTATCPARCPAISGDSTTGSGDFSDKSSHKQSAQIPSHEVLSGLITSYYNNTGEWAGIFRLGSLEKIRVERVSDTNLIAHVRYFYVPVPGNADGRTDTGYDQRTFVLNKVNGNWVVVRMGDHMSARL